MKYLILIIAMCFTFEAQLACEPSSKKKVISIANKKEKKKHRFIDLEGLDIQGMIDRPQTLYILKKSELNFSENYSVYDYVGAIVDITYQEPF